MRNVRTPKVLSQLSPLLRRLATKPLVTPSGLSVSLAVCVVLFADCDIKLTVLCYAQA